MLAQNMLKSRTVYGFGGNFEIKGGITYRERVAGSYEVMIYDRKTGQPVGKTWSDESGSYTFQHLAYRNYFLVAKDHNENPLNAGITDLIYPTEM
jgi:hypothetical protein